MNELAIHFPNLHELLQLDESLRFVDLHSGTPQLVTALFAQNPNIYDYAVNLSSAQVIQTIQPLTPPCDLRHYAKSRP